MPLVPPADIRMDPRKPDLLEHLRLSPVRVRMRHPDRGLKVAAPLVDRERLKGVPHAGTQRRVVEAESRDAQAGPRDSERPHRIPDADAFDVDRVGAMARRRQAVELFLLLRACDLVFGWLRITVPNVDE